MFFNLVIVSETIPNHSENYKDHLKANHEETEPKMKGIFTTSLPKVVSSFFIQLLKKEDRNKSAESKGKPSKV